MDNVRFGIVGIGNMGASHAKHLLAGAVNGATLAAVCDGMPENGSGRKPICPAFPFLKRRSRCTNPDSWTRS
ncbi:hypothetical protein PACILC2_51830 [Paenibacillus cisolokensis]|uniref:Gfo/Idh/MocA-like oxidoreductase N-terminal domain-containing protein n=1 Tax=Paenibacillus cisolokensis TaxID=1658519 RepID=A0ABQ4NEE7_9BACL|nr:hypothetical protein PACILC2_51830 [Paenibacillus cisolokensis]